MKDIDNKERYSLGEEIANSISHGVGTLLSLAGLVLLIVFSSFTGNPIKIVSVTIYGSTLFLLYLASTLYHSITNKKAKRVLEIIDHSMIFLLIAGTYTPFTLVDLKGLVGWTIFGLVWGIALVGIVFKVFFVRKFMILSTLAYILMGWIVVFAIKPLVNSLSLQGIFWLLAGGIFYTLGSIFYVYRKFKYHHFIWHIFVVLGSFCHFVAIFRYVI